MSSRSSSSVSKPASAAKSSSSSGQLLGLDLLDGDRELGLLAGEVLGAVVLGELDLDRALVAGGSALELLLEAGHEAAGAELDHLVAALAAAERHAVELPRKSMTTKSPEAAARSTVSSFAMRSRSCSTSLSIASSSTSGSRLADLEPLVLAELGLGADADLDREAQRLALAGELVEVEVGLADRDDLGGVDGGGVPAGDRLADRLVEHGLAPDALDDHGRRDLALAEAGDAQVAAERAWRPAATRFSTSAAGTSAWTRTRDSGSSVTVVETGSAMGGV